MGRLTRFRKIHRKGLAHFGRVAVGDHPPARIHHGHGEHLFLLGRLLHEELKLPVAPSHPHHSRPAACLERTDEEVCLRKQGAGHELLFPVDIFDRQYEKDGCKNANKPQDHERRKPCPS